MKFGSSVAATLATIIRTMWTGCWELFQAFATLSQKGYGGGFKVLTSQPCDGAFAQNEETFLMPIGLGVALLADPTCQL